MKRTMIDLHGLVLGWSHDRGILQNGKVTTQFIKLSSEVGELASSVANDESIQDDIGDCMVLLTNICYMSGFTFKEVFEGELVVELGGNPVLHLLSIVHQVGVLGDDLIKDKDIKPAVIKLWTLLSSFAFGMGVNPVDCWEVAWEDIKDRKGILSSSGNFVKESDPCYTQLKMELNNA